MKFWNKLGLFVLLFRFEVIAFMWFYLCAYVVRKIYIYIYIYTPILVDGGLTLSSMELKDKR